MLVQGVKVKYLSYLIEFIYNGNVDVPPNDLQKFLELGQELKVKGLAKKNKVVQNIQNSIKCETDETPEIPTVFEELESELISQDTYDPGDLDEPIDYEDHISLDRTELDHELGQAGFSRCISF